VKPPSRSMYDAMAASSAANALAFNCCHDGASAGGRSALR